MRFDKETRAKIQEAAPGSANIKWPAGQRQPEKGRVYRMQAAEDIAKANRRLEESPPKNRDVMAQMHKRFYDRWPKGYKPPRPKLSRTADAQILVLEVDPVGRHSWEATVVLFEEADPIRHSGVKARVRGGLNPLSTIAGDPVTGQTSTELEGEQILVKPSRSEREDEADALRLEHKASVDAKEIGAAQKRLAEQRRRGKPGTLAAQALERAKRRAEQQAA